MTDTSTKGQGSLRSHFFHVTPSRSDSKWRVKEVHANGAIACDTKEEALQRARELKNEVDNGHVVVHDEHGRFEVID